MRRYTYTLLFFGLLALVACRRDRYNPTITQYDDDQIKAYMSANGLSGFSRDTSGIYYKLLNPGRDTALQYTNNVSMVFTVKSVDGKYTSSDTLFNHYDGFLGHISTTTSPLGLDVVGLQQAIHDIVKRNGAIARIIVPSKLAYGVSGAGSGSSSNTAGRIAGNQSLDYYVHLIGDTVAQEAYDDMVIKNYITTNNITNIQKDPAGYWYQIREAGPGTVPITYQSSIIVTYTMTLLDGSIASQNNTTNGVAMDIPDLIPGVQMAMKKYGRAGALLTFLFPSRLGYGKLTTSLPPNSVLKYDVRILSVSP